MYKSDNVHYVFRLANGELWNFFHDEKLGLCYSTLTRRNNWTNPVVLAKGAHQAFFAEMDQEDRFHILSQDSQGSVDYSYLSGDSLKTVPILNSKNAAAYDKHLCLVPIKNNLHFFYVLQHENSFLLAYQTLSDGKLGNPKVVDYVPQNRYPVSILWDRASSIYAFYQCSDGKFLQLGYKKYNIVQKVWSEFYPVTKYSGTSEYPRVIADGNGLIHLCYQRTSPKLFEMVYLQKIPDKNLWTNETVIHSSVHPFEDASILWLNDSIIIYWVRDDSIYYNIGLQSGNSWGKPQKLNFPAGRQLVCMCYRTNNPYESSKLSLDRIPGSYAGGFRLAFYQQVQETGDAVSAEDLKNLILDSLRLLKDAVDELREGQSSLREELARLGASSQELEKELIKSSVRLKAVETQLAQAKALSNRLEAVERGLARGDGGPAKEAEAAAEAAMAGKRPAWEAREAADAAELAEAAELIEASGAAMAGKGLAEPVRAGKRPAWEAREAAEAAGAGNQPARAEPEPEPAAKAEAEPEKAEAAPQEQQPLPEGQKPAAMPRKAERKKAGAGPRKEKKENS